MRKQKTRGGKYAQPELRKLRGVVNMRTRGGKYAQAGLS